MVGFWLLLFFFGLLVFFALVSTSMFADDPNADVFDIFALNRYEWYRSLKADVQAAWRQLTRDWKRFCRFFEDNASWVFATLMGMLGLFFTALMIIGFIPMSVKSAFAETMSTERTLLSLSSRRDLIETRTSLPDPVYASVDPSVYMMVGELQPNMQPNRLVFPVAVEEIQVKEPHQHIRLFDRISESAQAFTDDNRELEVIAQPLPSDRVAEAHVLFNETFVGDVLRENNRVTVQVGDLWAEKTYPQSVVPGDPVSYEILLKNTGQKTIDRVRVEEAIPQLSRLENSVPRHESTNDAGRYIWTVDHLEPDETQSIRIELDAGQIEFSRTLTRVVVLTYSNKPDLTVRSKPEPKRPVVPREKVREPEVVPSRRKTVPPPKDVAADAISRLRLEITGPKQVRVGDDVLYALKLYNRGNEPIDNASIRIGLDSRVTSPKGKVIELNVTPQLKPQETRSNRFQGKAAKTGTASIKLQVLFGDRVIRSGTRRLEVLPAAAE